MAQGLGGDQLTVTGSCEIGIVPSSGGWFLESWRTPADSHLCGKALAAKVFCYNHSVVPGKQNVDTFALVDPGVFHPQ